MIELNAVNGCRADSLDRLVRGSNFTSVASAKANGGSRVRGGHATTAATSDAFRRGGEGSSPPQILSFPSLRACSTALQSATAARCAQC
jgi:hypothetical protein